jgi:hypothetical protein
MEDTDIAPLTLNLRHYMEVEVIQIIYSREVDNYVFEVHLSGGKVGEAWDYSTKVIFFSPEIVFPTYFQ